VNFYGLWISKRSQGRIEEYIQTGIWRKESYPNEENREGERKKISEMELGAKVFLYHGIDDVAIKDTEFSHYLPSDIYDHNKTIVKAKCSAIGTIKSKNIEDASLTIEWKEGYIPTEWYVYFRQDGIWNLAQATKKDLVSELHEVIFNHKPYDFEWWSKKLDWRKKKLDRVYTKNSNMETTKNVPLNQILYGPPGTGKTYNTINKALQIIDGAVPTNREEAKKRFEALKEAGQIEFVTFHQSYGYEEFVEGIKAKTTNSGIEYHIEAGIFKRLSEKAKVDNISFDADNTFSKLYDNFLNDLEYISDNESVGKEYKTKRGNTFSVFRNKFSIVVKANTTSISLSKDLLQRAINENKPPYYDSYVNVLLPIILKEHADDVSTKDDTEKNYLLIIDEINRGNISKIFGELITLIEESKRLGNEEAMEVTLPYSSGEKFGVPKNLYILGTMNTADRSIALMDTALRRRFEFVEMMPKAELLGVVDGIDLGALLSTINKRIEYLYDRDHTIGHAYFMGVSNKTELDGVMRNKVIPLLQEYFYDDWEKIRLVLNDGFILSTSQDAGKLFDAIDDEYMEEDKYVYSIADDFSVDAYRKIYGKIEQIREGE